MNTGYIPKLSLGGISPSSMFQTELTGQVRRIEAPSGVEGPSFKNTLGNVVHSVSDTLSAPDALMSSAMSGDSVDVHDVMIANAKADLAISVTSQIVTKVVQAYDKILQIQI